MSLTTSPCEGRLSIISKRIATISSWRSCHKVAREWIYSPSRIKYPMKRKGWQPGGGENSNGQMRGKDEWERISWDEALDLCAAGDCCVYMEPMAPMHHQLYQHGRLDPECSEPHGWLRRDQRHYFLRNMAGGYELVGPALHGNYMGDDPQDWVYADYFVRVLGSRVYRERFRRLSDGCERSGSGNSSMWGPCYNQGATQLEARWIPVRPGTDTAFWNGVAYEMVKLDESTGDVIDWEFLAKYQGLHDGQHALIDAQTQECYQGYLLGEYDDTPKQRRGPASFAVHLSRTSRTWPRS